MGESEKSFKSNLDSKLLNAPFNSNNNFGALKTQYNSNLNDNNKINFQGSNSNIARTSFSSPTNWSSSFTKEFLSSPPEYSSNPNPTRIQYSKTGTNDFELNTARDKTNDYLNKLMDKYGVKGDSFKNFSPTSSYQDSTSINSNLPIQYSYQYTSPKTESTKSVYNNPFSAKQNNNVNDQRPYSYLSSTNNAYSKFESYNSPTKGPDFLINSDYVSEVKRKSPLNSRSPIESTTPELKRSLVLSSYNNEKDTLSIRDKLGLSDAITTPTNLTTNNAYFRNPLVEQVIREEREKILKREQSISAVTSPEKKLPTTSVANLRKNSGSPEKFKVSQEIAKEITESVEKVKSSSAKKEVVSKPKRNVLKIPEDPKFGYKIIALLFGILLAWLWVILYFEAEESY